MNKLEIVKQCITTSVGKELSQQVIKQLVEDDNIETKQKMDILHQARNIDGLYIDNMIIEQVLFYQEEQLSAEEKLKEYIWLSKGIWNERAYDTIYRLYVESGKISNQLFDKEQMYGSVVPCMEVNSIEDLDVYTEQKYSKIGDYYVLHTNNVWNDGTIFNSKGKKVGNKYFTDNDKIVEYLKGNDKIGIKLIEEILDKKHEITDGKELSEVRFFENMIGFRDGETEQFYLINSEGNLERIVEGEKRRIRDDMSELDKKLQEQTQDVSMTEILGVLEEMNLHRNVKINGKINEKKGSGRED